MCCPLPRSAAKVKKKREICKERKRSRKENATTEPAKAKTPKNQISEKKTHAG